MDRAASKGVIHKNQAANRKSGIMLLIKDVVMTPPRRLREAGPRRSSRRPAPKAAAKPSAWQPKAA
ncbi:MAG: 30S ribosomal protein S20 [Gordonibacter urolithinfaciens]